MQSLWCQPPLYCNLPLKLYNLKQQIWYMWDEIILSIFLIYWAGAIEEGTESSWKLILKQCGIIKANHQAIIIYVLINRDPNPKCNNSKHFFCYCQHVKPEFYQSLSLQKVLMKRFFGGRFFFSKQNFERIFIIWEFSCWIQDFVHMYSNISYHSEVCNKVLDKVIFSTLEERKELSRISR
jgi:hypothetical protein